MRFLLLCPLALLLMAALATCAIWETETEKRWVRNWPRLFPDNYDEARRYQAEGKALREQNKVLEAKLAATQAEASRLRESNCPT